MSSGGAEGGGGRWRLPRVLSIAAVLLFVGLLAYGLTTQGSSERIDESLAEGEAPLAPEFDLPVLARGAPPSALEQRLRAALTDGALDLAELAGTPFVLNFWASWCVPCREEAPILERGWGRHSNRGVLYLGLNMQDVTDDALAFIEEFGISYPTIRDQSNDVAQTYGATGIPETYFVTARGRVAGHVIGVVSRAQLDQGAAAARRGRPIGTLSGGARRVQP